MREKLCQCTVGSKSLEEGTLESGTSNQNIEGNTVIENTHTMFGVRWNNTNVPGVQCMGNSLYGGVCGSIINTQNLKKFMLMNINGRITVMLTEHNISIEVLEYITFFNIRKPCLIKKNRNIKIVTGNQFFIQSLAIFPKSLRMILLCKIQIPVKNLIWFVSMYVILKFASG